MRLTIIHSEITSTDRMRYYTSRGSVTAIPEKIVFQPGDYVIATDSNGYSFVDTVTEIIGVSSRTSNVRLTGESTFRKVHTVVPVTDPNPQIP